MAVADAELSAMSFYRHLVMRAPEWFTRLRMRTRLTVAVRKHYTQRINFPSSNGDWGTALVRGLSNCTVRFLKPLL